MSVYKELAAQILRDAALEQVYYNAPEDWKAAALNVVLSMKSQLVTGEDIRLACEARNIKPHHHNAWGAFISSLKRQGVLAPTGKWVNMRGPKSNARKTELYHVR
jgi:hypothetical protein